MTDYPVGEVTRNGVTVQITVNEHDSWKAEHGGKVLRASTRSDLVDKITRAIRQTTVKVEVPITLVINKGTDGIKFRRGVATGIHGSNGNVLVTWQSTRGDVKEQVTGSAFGRENPIFGDVPIEVLSEYGDLVKALAEATYAEREFRDKHEIDLKQTVEQAVAEARTESQPEE